MACSRHTMDRVVLSGIAIAAAILASGANAQEQSPKATPLPSYMKERDGRADPNVIKRSEAMYTLYAMISSLEAQKPTSGRALLVQGAELDTATADKVVAHIIAASSEHRAYGKTMLASNCQALRSAVLTTEQLAVKLTQAEALERQNREPSYAQLANLLTPADRQKLDEWLDTTMRSSMQAIDVDYKSLLTEGGVDRRILIARMCDQADK